jgi:uncharacterized repeat protein (TIGR01451 family)
MMERNDGIRSGDGRGRAWITALALLVLATAPNPRRLAAQSADVSITKTGPAQAEGNRVGTITYLIVTTNNGPSTATNVVVRDTLPPPPDHTFISASRSPTRTGRRLTWPAITLASGASVVDTVVIRVDAGPGVVLTNVAVVSAAQADPDVTNNLSRVLTLAVDATVVGVAVTPDGVDTLRQLPRTASGYSYAFTVTNTGSVVSDYDLLAAVGGGGASFVTVDSITGTAVTRGVPPDSARLAGLAAGGSAGVLAWYRVANVAAGSLESLRMLARSAVIPAVQDSGRAFVQVVKPAIVTVKGVSPAGVQAPGAELTYTMTVANGGSEAAADVVMVDSLPAEVEFKVGSVASLLPGGMTVVVEYSTDGADWTYVPISTGCAAPAGFDRCVTHIRWTLQQPLGAVAPDNTATLEFVARIR